MRVAVAATAAALAVLLACASNPKPHTNRDRVVPPPGSSAEGVASWYGPGYDGKRTACGERFDQDALTAAHGSWACGTKARVTLLSTGKSVVVRINDLFPNHKGRLIDLSHEAAKRIGLLGPGTGRVRLEVVE